MSIVGAFVVPHPPLIVPEVGRGDEKKIENTIKSYEMVAEEIGKLKPDTIVISSPHAPLYSDCFYLPKGDYFDGSFERFGASKIRFHEEYDKELIDEIDKISLERKIPVYREEISNSRDHGTMVPLYFIKKHISNPKIVVVGLTGISLEKNKEMGIVIKDAIEKLNKRVVYVASGDLSHKLQDYGPYGFEKDGPVYDTRIIVDLKTANFDNLLKYDLDFLDRVAECGHRSFIIMSGALDKVDVKPRFYSHEDVTGVGYGICSYYPVDKYVKLARDTINLYVKEKRIIDVPDDLPSEMLNERKACFVSIHKNGDLRGCIGTILPVRDSLAEEIIDNAISACTNDYRFDPVTPDELDSLEINVDVLTIPEEVEDRSTLDCKKYGVIVRNGFRKGVLLPDIDGVDTVEDQIRIALSKAGINRDEEYKIERFEVIRHK